MNPDLVGAAALQGRTSTEQRCHDAGRVAHTHALVILPPDCAMVSRCLLPRHHRFAALHSRGTSTAQRGPAAPYSACLLFCAACLLFCAAEVGQQQCRQGASCSGCGTWWGGRQAAGTPIPNWTLQRCQCSGASRVCRLCAASGRRRPARRHPMLAPGWPVSANKLQSWLLRSQLAYLAANTHLGLLSPRALRTQAEQRASPLASPLCEQIL